MRRIFKAATETGLDRRGFLRASVAAAGGLLVVLCVDRRSLAAPAGQPAKAFPAEAFVHIRPDGKVVITVNRIECGQGVHTALPMILADEMDADWSDVVAELAPVADVYKDPVFGIQMVGGSSSIANSFQQYRELGARTRAMLVATAADRWRVSPSRCRTENSVVYGPAGQSARYAELAGDAARKPVPDTAPLKKPSEFRLIGKPTRRLDGEAKCDGSQKFGLDLDLPGMKIALVARPPVFGGRVRTLDDVVARAITGVRDVFTVPLVAGTGVAVVADGFWAAKQARDRLKIDWDLSGVEHPDTARLTASFKAQAATPGHVAVRLGDPRAMDRIADGDRVAAEYEFPYLAHAPLEPLNATVRFDGDHAEAWVSSELPTLEHAALADVLGLAPDRVTYHIDFAGGAFGRRATLDMHLQREVGVIAKRMRGTPIKLVWTREDDIAGGYYRTMAVHRVAIGIGGDGMPAAWNHVVVGQSFMIGSGNPFEPFLVKDGLDYLVVEGTADMPYAIPSVHVSAHHPKVNVPVSAWRSVGYSHNTFVIETLIDELATRARIDPIAYRLKLFRPDAAKFRSVMRLLDEKAAWRDQLPAGHALGVACSTYHNTGVALAVDVSIVDQRPRIHRATVTVDCGLAVNPLTIENQLHGGLVFGLTQLMARGAVTLKEGRVEQRNFDGFTPPYIGDAPAAVDVHIVPSGAVPTGIGETPVPVIAPAVVNALARLTGRRYRSLPLTTL